MSLIQRKVTELLSAGNKSEKLIIIIMKDDFNNMNNIPSSPCSLPSSVQVFATKDYSENEKNLLLRFLMKTPLYELEHELNIFLIRPALSNMTTLVFSWKSTTNLVQHYRRIFQAILQQLCKEVAKKWIKILEPNKQAKYPYKGFNASKPFWWPENIDHTEPDHLDKYGRISLLVSIIRNRSLSLTELKNKVQYLHSTQKYLRNLLDELFYVAAYDRIFYNPERNDDPLFQYLSSEEQGVISCAKTFKIAISDLITTKGGTATRLGIVMVSQIDDCMLNRKVFKINEVEKKKPCKPTRKRTRSVLALKIKEEEEEENYKEADGTYKSCNQEVVLKDKKEHPIKVRRTSSLTTSKIPKSLDSQYTNSQEDDYHNHYTPQTSPSSAVDSMCCNKPTLPSLKHNHIGINDSGYGLQLILRSNPPSSPSPGLKHIHTTTTEFDDASQEETDRGLFKFQSYDSDCTLPNVDSPNYIVAQEILTHNLSSPPPSVLHSWHYDCDSSSEDVYPEIPYEGGEMSAIHS